MKADSHSIIGLGVAVGLATANDVRSPALFAGIVAAAVIGALLPDIDHPGSRISRRLPIVGLPFQLLCGHRGFTHSLVGLVGLLLTLATLRAPVWLAMAGLFGYASHIVADMMTVNGVQLLWPIRWRLQFLPQRIAIRTGSNFEPLAAFAVAGLWILVMSGV